MISFAPVTFGPPHPECVRQILLKHLRLSRRAVRLTERRDARNRRPDCVAREIVS